MIRHLATAAAALLNLIPSSIEQAAARRSLVWLEEENEVHDPPTKPLPVVDCEPQSADFDDEPGCKWCFRTDCWCDITPQEACRRVSQAYHDGVAAFHASRTPAHTAGATSGAVEGILPADVPPTSAGTDLTWIEYVTPAITDVLAVHEPRFILQSGYIDCCQNDSRFSTKAFPDWKEWREHVAPLIAARLEDVTLALPGDEAPQYIKPLQ